MSLAELKEQASRLSPEERLDLAAFLADLDDANEAQFRQRVDQRMQRMDSGRKVSQDELERAHAQLVAQSKTHP